MNLIIRIIGNDLPFIHSDNQTYNNLEFTLKNEKIFKNTDKLFVLNRIVDELKKTKIISLLQKYKFKYLDIPFEYSQIKSKHPKLALGRMLQYTLKENWNKAHNPYLNKIINELLECNLYVINNNGCRNFCIDYGIKNKYEIIFVLDSNSFFLEKDYYEIINKVNKSTNYIIIPQKRLDDGNIRNSRLLDFNNSLDCNINNLPTQEPQIAFQNLGILGYKNGCNNDKKIYNENIPYGLSPKAELLNALEIKGKWNNWTDHNLIQIPGRKFKLYQRQCQILSKILRLNSQSNRNNIKSNFIGRWIGLYILIRRLHAKRETNESR